MTAIKIDDSGIVNSGRITSWTYRNFNRLVLFLLLGIYGICSLELPFGVPIRSDGSGYYAYLPSLIIYGDPSFEEVARKQYGGAYPDWTGLLRHPETGLYFNKFNMGVAVFTLPFFLSAHALTWLMKPPTDPVVNANLFKFNFALDGYSPIYQHAAGLCGVFYFWLGIVVLRRLLLSKYPPGPVHATLAILLLGGNLLDIGAIGSYGSHAISFFLFALFIETYLRWRSEAGWRMSLFLGLIMGAIAMVRVTNIVVFSAFLLVPLTSFREIPGQIKFIFNRVGDVLIVALAAAGFFIPQMLMWKYSCGSYLVNSYGNVGLPNLLSPAIADVLFSIKKGIFVWHPALALVLPGLFLMIKNRDSMPWFVFMILSLQVYIISSAAQWYAGGSFGQRYMSEYLVLEAFPIAYFLSKQSFSKTFQLGLTGIIFFSCLWTLFLLKLFATREIHIEGLDANALYDVVWWRFQAIKDFLLMLFQ